MSLEYEFDEGIIRFKFRGSTASEEIFEVFHNAYNAPECPKDANLEIDLRESTSLGTRSTETVRTFSEFIVNHPDRPGQRIALLLSPEEKKRFAELAGDFRQAVGLDIGLFVEEEAARTWLRSRASDSAES